MQQYIPTLYTLEHFSDQNAFERLSLDILNSSGNTIVTPVANRGGGDGGQDIVYTNLSDEKSCAFVSLEKKGLAKFKKDAAKHKKGVYKEYSYFTTAYLSYDSKKKITEIALNDLGAIVHMYDIESIRSLLDTRYTNLRSSYLGIDVEVKSSYEILSSNTRKYSAVILEKHGQDLYRTTKERFTSRNSMANTLPVSFSLPSLSSLGIRSAEEILAGIRLYQQEVDIFNKNLSNLYSFNLTIQSDIYDENVEVQITSEDDVSFSFENGKLDKPKEPNLSEVADLFPGREVYIPDFDITPSHRNGNEFYTTHNDDGKIIFSKIDTINPNQSKTLFDERVFIKTPGNLQEVKLNYIVYSKYSKASEQEYTLDLKDAELIEVMPNSRVKDGN